LIPSFIKISKYTLELLDAYFAILLNKFSIPISYIKLFICSSFIFLFPKVILFLTVSTNIYGFCDIYEIFSLKHFVEIFEISQLSINIFPFSISYNFINTFVIVVFPTPVLPAIATLVPFFIIKDIFLSLKEIIVGSTSNVNEENVNKRLEEIYYTQSKLGATSSIDSLEKEVQAHFTKQKAIRNRRQTKVEAKHNNVQKINNNEENILQEENNLEL